MTKPSAFEKVVDKFELEIRRHAASRDNDYLAARAELLAQHDRDIAAAVAAEQARMAENSTEGFIAALNRFEGAIQNRDSEGFRAARADVLVAREHDIAAAITERDARIRALEEALRPFASWGCPEIPEVGGDRLFGLPDDEEILHCFREVGSGEITGLSEDVLTAGAFRRARAALATGEQK